jgi:nicotinate dehydrogenase subunit A
MPDTIAFTLNGRPAAAGADPEAPLLYVLRNDLGLKGARYGCGLGQCGACTVLLDGQPVQSCNLPLSAVAGRAVTTIEALGTPDAPHPLQQAFIDEQAAQCGYCVSGIVMSAYALLERNPRPTDGEIRAALDNHLCRCGTHARILKAVARAAGRVK